MDGAKGTPRTKVPENARAARVVRAELVVNETVRDQFQVPLQSTRVRANLDCWVERDHVSPGLVKYPVNVVNHLLLS